MKNCLRLKDMSNQEVLEMLNLAIECKSGKYDNTLANKIVANLFFEPSTRTQYSFNVAQERLGMKVITFNPASSSLLKGETFYDTVKTFESFGLDAMVIRSEINQYYKQLENKINVPIINAGDGVMDHPSQSLLDLMTIYNEFGKFEGLKIAIVGDVKHSRVAHTNIEIMQRLGMEVFISGPEEFKEEGYDFIEFDKAVTDMDVIMLLRIQHERHADDYQNKLTDYNQQYGLNNQRLKMMKQDTIIMHPAPFNRNVEISDDVVECSKSRIFEQVNNGVYVRMAILLTCLGGK